MTPLTPAGQALLTDNFGLPITEAGQMEHSRQHRDDPSEHTLIGYCDVAQRIKRIEQQAADRALAQRAIDFDKTFDRGFAAGRVGALAELRREVDAIAIMVIGIDTLFALIGKASKPEEGA